MQLQAPAPPASLDRVLAALEKRGLQIASRVGAELSGNLWRPGKMLRARFALALGSALDAANSEDAAVAAELAHNASVLHDDCVDHGTLRRGRPTPNALFGVEVGLLLGDLAFVEALDCANGISSAAGMGLVQAVREMIVGELQEEFLRGSLSVSVAAYLGLAGRKTGSLFEWVARTVSANSRLPHCRETAARLGRRAGILLQIVDDIHDWTLDPATSGKDTTQDLSGRRLNLPLILALRENPARRTIVRAWRSARPGVEADGVRDLLQEGGFIESARTHAWRLLDELMGLAGSLSSQNAGDELTAFLEALARREF